MNLNLVLPFISAGIMLAFVIAVLSRWWRRKRAYLLAWAVGLSMFGIGSFAEAFSAGVSLAEQYKEIMPKGAWVWAMTPLFNIYGLIALVGGAVYSAWLFWRFRIACGRAS